MGEIVHLRKKRFGCDRFDIVRSIRILHELRDGKRAKGLFR